MDVGGVCGDGRDRTVDVQHQCAGLLQNLQFRFKMSLLVLAGLNVLIFNLTAGRSVHRWNTDKAAPLSGKLAGAFSLLLWIGVIFLGRWVGFTKGTDLTPDLDILLKLDRF